MKPTENEKFTFELLLNISQKEFNDALQSQNGYLLLYRLYGSLVLCFAVRERYIGIRESDGIFRGLKKFMNILKHDNDMDLLLKYSTIPEGEETNSPIFPAIENVTTRDPQEIEQYNIFVKGKEIKMLMDKLYQCTFCALCN